VETVGPTGVEMEALTAVQIALLTIYDMCKAVDRSMSIHDVRVVEKHGGNRGALSLIRPFDVSRSVQAKPFGGLRTGLSKPSDELRANGSNLIGPN
jgi:hypothetical protein